MTLFKTGTLVQKKSRKYWAIEITTSSLMLTDTGGPEGSEVSKGNRGDYLMVGHVTGDMFILPAELARGYEEVPEVTPSKDHS